MARGMYLLHMYQKVIIQGSGKDEVAYYIAGKQMAGFMSVVTYAFTLLLLERSLSPLHFHSV